MNRALMRGLVSYLPPLNRLLSKGTGGTSSSRYCYSTWLRHLVMAHQHSLPPRPKVVAEFGPGDSIGIGLAALISGADSYLAFDTVAFADLRGSVRIFEELVGLFHERETIPGEDEFPNITPRLESHEFPRHILPDEHLDHALAPSRLRRIADSLEDVNGEDSVIKYAVPWHDSRFLRGASVDMVYSQAVMEHVDELGRAYSTMHSLLRPGGFMSHQIDFTSHGTARQWNGHWAYSDFYWSLIRGRQPFLLNREPYSTHRRLIVEAEFEIVGEAKVKNPSEIHGMQLAPRFRTLSEDDLTTSGAFVLAWKVL